jgi:hypothetical protein
MPRSAISTTDIRLTADIVISAGVAARVVDIIEKRRKYLLLQGSTLHPLDEEIQRALRECVDLRATYADASTKVVLSQHVLPSDSELLTSNDVAIELGIKPAGVRWHCKNNGLGRKVGSRWVIDREDLNMHKLSRSNEVA